MEETAACLKSFFGVSYGFGFNASGGYSFVHLAPISGLEDKLPLDHLDPQWWHQKRSTKQRAQIFQDQIMKNCFQSNTFQKGPHMLWMKIFVSTSSNINKKNFRGAQDSDETETQFENDKFYSNPTQSNLNLFSLRSWCENATHGMRSTRPPCRRVAKAGWCKVGFFGILRWNHAILKDEGMLTPKQNTSWTRGMM